MSEDLECSYCGTLNSYGSKYCNNCGNRLGIEQIQKVITQPIAIPQPPPAPPPAVQVQHIHHGPDFCTVFCYVLLALCLIPIIGVIIFVLWLRFSF